MCIFATLSTCWLTSCFLYCITSIYDIVFSKLSFHTEFRLFALKIIVLYPLVRVPTTVEPCFLVRVPTSVEPYILVRVPTTVECVEPSFLVRVPNTAEPSVL